LLLILLICPVKLRFAWNGEKLELVASYLFLRFDVSPDALAAKAEKISRKLERKIKKDKPRKKKEPKEEDDSGKKKFTPETLAAAIGLLRDAGGAWSRLRRHIVFYRVRLYIVVCGGDAHDTAIKHGQYSTGVFGLIALLQEIFSMQNPTVFLYPDFTGQKTRFDISFRLRVRPIFALTAGVYFLYRFTKVKLFKDKIKSKGGKKNEPISVSK
jgi:hypothetical protein